MTEAPRLTVAITVDHDAISDSIRRGDPPVKLSATPSSGRASARSGSSSCSPGAAIPTTWFVPGHTLTTFPDDTEAIIAGGHELACHGWFHEDFASSRTTSATESWSASVEAVACRDRRRAGRVPGAVLVARARGRSSSSRRPGSRYDSSLMAGDYELYRVRHGDRHSSADGTTWGRAGSLVEVPVYWAMDDWPHFEPGDERATGSRRRRRSSRSGPRSCGTPMSTPRAAWSWSRCIPSASAAATGWRCSSGSSTRPRRSRRRRLRAARRGRQPVVGGEPLTADCQASPTSRVPDSPTPLVGYAGAGHPVDARRSRREVDTRRLPADPVRASAPASAPAHLP